MSVSDFSKTIAGSQLPQASAGWLTGTGGNAYVPYSANVVWQDTTSNATYCSASQALSASG